MIRGHGRFIPSGTNMSEQEPTVRNFIAAFRGRWLEAMSGGFSVPFATLAVISPEHYQKTIFGLMAFAAVWFAAYRIWAYEREKVVYLTNKTTPGLRLSFDAIDEQYPGITTAVIFQPNAFGKMVGSGFAKYVRIWVHASSGVPILDCSAAITRVSIKSDSPTFEPLVMPQMVPVGPTKFHVKLGMPVHLDFLIAESKNNTLSFAPNIPWPLIWKGIFEIADSIQIDFVVSSGTSVERLRVEIDWNGDWSKITGRSVEIV